MPREYYACAFRLSGKDEYLLWYSDDSDGVHVDAAGCVPTFGSIASLRSHAEIHGLAPFQTEEPILHDLDAISHFVQTATTFEAGFNETHYNKMLAAWNLFGDLARSPVAAGAGFLECDGENDPLYDKIFHACNLPAMTPDGEKYVPTWSSDEFESLQEVLGVGLRLFTAVISRQH